MKIAVTFHIGDLERRAINAHLGKPGLASRAEVAAFLWGHANADLQVVVSEHEKIEEIDKALPKGWSFYGRGYEHTSGVYVVSYVGDYGIEYWTIYTAARPGAQALETTNESREVAFAAAEKYGKLAHR